MGRRAAFVGLLCVASCGCSAILNLPSRDLKELPNSVSSLDYPEIKTARWKHGVRAILNDPPEEVFAYLNQPIQESDKLPKGTKITIDNSASESGPDQWGVGSVARREHIMFFEITGRRFAVSPLAVRPPHQLIHRIAFDNKGNILRGIVIHELKPAPDGATELTIYSFCSPDSTLAYEIEWASNVLADQAIKRMTDRFGGKRVPLKEPVSESVSAANESDSTAPPTQSY